MISAFFLDSRNSKGEKIIARSVRFASRGHVLLTRRDYTDMEHSHEIASRKGTLSSVVSADTAAEMSRANTDSPYPYSNRRPRLDPCSPDAWPVTNGAW